MQQKKKKLPFIVKIILLVLLVILLAVGAWLADYFLIPKVEKTGIKAPVDYHTEVAAAETDVAATDTAEETSTDQTREPDDKYPVLLDQFPTDMLEQPVEAGTGSMDDPEGTTVLGASDDGINQIVVTKTVTGEGDEKLTYFVADIHVADVKELKTCLAKDTYGENVYEKTTEMAARCQAILAVNGDCYGWRDDGIVIRNGQLLRDQPAREGLAVYQDGHIEVYDETQTNGQALVDAGVWNTFSFGPALIQNGQQVDGLHDDYQVDLTGGLQHKHPRTAIGQINSHHFVLVVVDGRQPGYSRGARMWELADIMQSLGCETAYNLDGGSSATMYFKGQVVNHFCPGKTERAVSDCIFIN